MCGLKIWNSLQNHLDRHILIKIGKCYVFHLKILSTLPLKEKCKLSSCWVADGFLNKFIYSSAYFRTKYIFYGKISMDNYHVLVIFYLYY